MMILFFFYANFFSYSQWLRNEGTYVKVNIKTGVRIIQLKLVLFNLKLSTSLFPRNNNLQLLFKCKIRF